MTKSNWFLSLLLLALAPSSGLWAGTLLESEGRPTVQEVLANYGEIIEEPGIPAKVQNPERGHWTAWDHFVKAIPADGPRIIAELERAYPGAKFAFLGRDVHAVADLVEAFYLSIGETDRVTRIGVSKGTFAPSETRTMAKKFVDLLKQEGLELDDLKNQARPLILVDTISKGGGSQGKQILSYVYDYYRSLGKDPSELVSKFNMVGLLTQTSQIEIHPVTSVEILNARLESEYRNGTLQDTRTKHQIVTVNSSPSKINEMGYEHFTLSWHGSFGPLLRKGGKVTSSPGPVNDEKQRKSILWYQKKILEAVNDAGFLTRVKAVAQELGMKWQPKRARSSAMCKVATAKNSKE